MTEPKRTPAWVWIGCGCFAAVGLAVLAVAGLGFFGYRTAKGFVDTLENPEARAAKVREILGAETLPEGYNAQLFLHVPFVMDMAILSDAPPATKTEDHDYEPRMGDRGFLWVAVRGSDRDRGRLRRYLTAESDDAELDVDVKIDVELEPRERLAKGTFTQEPAEVLWSIFRGRIQSDTSRRDGTFAMVMADCPGDSRLRFGYWWLADPAAEGGAGGGSEDAGENDVETVVEAAPGAVASQLDEAAVRAFLGHFALCQR